jgi:hypothetical protein
MKDREYYQRLISESLDRPLSSVESEELKQAIRDDAELARFQRAVMKQAEVIRSLPDFSTEAALRLPPERSVSRSFFKSLWNIRISLPLPAAALLLLAFVGIGLYGMFTSRISEEPKTKQWAQEIKYVQIERLKPAKAVLIQQKQDNNSPNKEGL